MAINIRQKGAGGEREIIGILQPILDKVLLAKGWSTEQRLKYANAFQRNQNQSAVGGNDISNTFGLSLEIKRQEALSVNTWWQQCCAAAAKTGETPVLIYRQNRKPWYVVTNVLVPLPDGAGVQVRATFDMPSFKVWFEHWISRKIDAGWQLQS